MKSSPRQTPILITLTAALAAFASLCDSYAACTFPPSGLVSWWKAETNALDPVGGNNGTLVGVTRYGPGRIGQAFEFDGIQVGVDLGAATNLKLQNFTIEAWIRRGSETLASQEPFQVGYIYGFSWGGYALAMADDGRLILSKVGYSAVSSTNAVSGTNTFHHVAVTKNGTNVVFYMDSVAETAAAYNPGFEFVNSRAAIGARGLDFRSSFTGLIDELSVYDRALDASEIKSIFNSDSSGNCAAIAPIILSEPLSHVALIGETAIFQVLASATSPVDYQWLHGGTNLAGATNSSLILTNVQLLDAGVYSVIVTTIAGAETSSNATLIVNSLTGCSTPPSGLVSWWNAEGNALDLAGENNGTLVGDTTFGIGRVGQAFQFDGSYDGVSVGNTTSLQLQNFTIEAWIRRGSATLASQDRYQSGVLFGCSWGGYMLGLGDDGRLILSKIGYSAVYSTNAITGTNAFHHVAVTKNGDNVVFYVDSVAETAAAYDPGFIFIPGPAAIGALGSSYGASFLGVIDELSIYDRVLTELEIQSIYRTHADGKCMEPPTISSQSQGQSVTAGNLAFFNITASGVKPLTYQWLRTGTNIDGATAASLILTNVQLLDVGTYTAIVSNVAGVATSSDAILTVKSAKCLPAPPGLISWWKAENNGLNDNSSDSGVLAGDTAFTSGRVGRAFLFDGIGDAVLVGASPGLKLQSFTIEAWIRRSNISLATVHGGGGILFAYGLGGYGFGINDNGELFLSKIGIDAIALSTGIQDTDFHHVAVAKKETNVVFYIDGVSYSVRPYSTTYTFSSTAAVGARGDTLANGFFGAIDECSIYNRQLSGSEIRGLYDASGSGKCPTSSTPTLLSQPQNQAVPYGRSATFVVTVAGTQPLSYQWQRNGINLSGANGASLVLTNVQLSDTGTFAVVTENLAGSAISSNATLEVTFSPPSVVRGPIPRLFNTGVDDTGSLLPSAVRDPHYQLIKSDDPTSPGPDAFTVNDAYPVSWPGPWLGDGPDSRWIAPRADQNTGGNLDPAEYRFETSFDLSGLDPSKARITGRWSVDNSGVDILLNDESLSITKEYEVNRTLAFEDWSDFTIDAGFNLGTNTLVFIVWNGVPNEFRRTRDPTGVRVELRGTIELPPIATAPSIVTPPTSLTAVVGDSASFSALADGTPPFSYQWQVKGSNITGATERTYTIDVVKLSDIGDYAVLVKNNFGENSSAVATLTVLEPIQGLFNTGLNQNGVVLGDGSADANYTLVVNSSGDAPSSPVVHDSTAFPIVAGPWLANSAKSKWIRPQVETNRAASGDYVYRVYVDLTGFDPTTAFISGLWTSDNNGEILLNGLATGLKSGGIVGSFSSFKLTNGFLAGTNLLDFRINNRSLGYTGLRLEDIRGGARRGSAGDSPRLVSQPVGGRFLVGEFQTLSVVADGAKPLQYLWMRDNRPIAGQTEPSLNFANFTLEDSGEYSVTVSNGTGSTNSAAVQVTVLERVPGIFNTGVDTNGSASVDGAVDPHYRLILNVDSPSQDAFVHDSTVFPIVAGPWIANSAESRWIAPLINTTPAAAGDYTYATTFDLAGFDLATVVLQGTWATDNLGVDIKLNGSSTGLQTGAQATALTPFTLTSGFIAGVNTLEFLLNNASVGYTGLRVDRLRVGGLRLGLGVPMLEVTGMATEMAITWPTTAIGYKLFSSRALISASWKEVIAPIVVANGKNTVKVGTSEASEFYRLQNQ